EQSCQWINRVMPSSTRYDRERSSKTPLESAPLRTHSPRIQWPVETRGSGVEMAVRIKAGMEKVPGGLMLVPLLVGAVIHTAAPDAGAFFRSCTGAMFTGLAPILGVFYVCLGATLDLKATPYI